MEEGSVLNLVFGTNETLTPAKKILSRRINHNDIYILQLPTDLLLTDIIIDAHH